MKRLLILAFALIPLLTRGIDFRGSQFIGISDFSKFSKKGVMVVSPEIQPEINWDELVLSWNLRDKVEAKFQVQIIYSDTNWWYDLGVWSAAQKHSFSGQENSLGVVDTDTLHIKRPGAKVRVRIWFDNTMPAVQWGMPGLKFIGLAFRDSKRTMMPLEPNRRVWGKTIDVPQRSQLDYQEGAKIWCSPTSTSMILDYWSHKLNRPELSMPVPDVAKSVYDSFYKGTGNWPFNTAFAASFDGMRAYISRLTDISELEDWIEAGIPIATSVSYNRLKGKGAAGSGHLIVCVGFTDNGDIVVNDPGTHLSNVRRTFSREIFREAWADSGNTVYIIYPENVTIPPARFGHWENRVKP
jgi:hypothetical protein